MNDHGERHAPHIDLVAVAKQVATQRGIPAHSSPRRSTTPRGPRARPRVIPRTFATNASSSGRRSTTASRRISIRSRSPSACPTARSGCARDRRRRRVRAEGLGARSARRGEHDVALRRRRDLPDAARRALERRDVAARGRRSPRGRHRDRRRARRRDRASRRVSRARQQPREARLRRRRRLARGPRRARRPRSRRPGARRAAPHAGRGGAAPARGAGSSTARSSSRPSRRGPSRRTARSSSLELVAQEPRARADRGPHDRRERRDRACLEERGFASIRRVVRKPKRWDRIVELAPDAARSCLPSRTPSRSPSSCAEHAKDPKRFADLSLAS